MLDGIQLLRDNGIAVVGAGANIAEARRRSFIEKKGMKLAFLDYCSNLGEILWPLQTGRGLRLYG